MHTSVGILSDSSVGGVCFFLNFKLTEIKSEGSGVKALHVRMSL